MISLSYSKWLGPFILLDVVPLTRNEGRQVANLY